MKKEDLINKWEKEIEVLETKISENFMDIDMLMILKPEKNSISACLKELKELEPIHDVESKALNLQRVSQRSELLAFIQFVKEKHLLSFNSIDNTYLVDEYIKANCG